MKSSQTPVPRSVGDGVERLDSPQKPRIFMKPEVEIYDTTLRDGSQGESINFSVADKLRIAETLFASRHV
jgi:hypothetical protein